MVCKKETSFCSCVSLFAADDSVKNSFCTAKFKIAVQCHAFFWVCTNSPFGFRHKILAIRYGIILILYFFIIAQKLN